MTSGMEHRVPSGRTQDPTAEPPPPSAYLQGLLDSLPAAILVSDGEGSIRYAAGQLDRLGGRSYGELLGTRVTDIVSGAPERELLEQLVVSTAAVPDGHMVGPARLAYSGLHGSELHTEVWAVNRTGKAGISGVVLLFLPESAYSRFDRILTSTVGRSVPLEQAFGAVALALRHPPVAGEAYFLVPGEDDRGTVRTPNLDGVPGPPLEGPWDEIWAGAPCTENESLSALPKPLAEAARTAGFGSVSCFSVRQPATGRAGACLVVWRRTESKMTPAARLAVEKAVVVASLVRAHRATEEVVRDPSLTDALTGLGNRKSLVQLLDGHVEAGEQPAILYLDLYGFQQVNDTLGRLAGDAVLRVTARRLASVMRPTDEIARLAGDEFAVVCNGSPSSDQMVMIAERVIQQLSRPLSVGDAVNADVGVSVGIALDFPVGTAVEDLLAGRRRTRRSQGQGQGTVGGGHAGGLGQDRPPALTPADGRQRRRSRRRRQVAAFPRVGSDELSAGGDEVPPQQDGPQAATEPPPGVDAVSCPVVETVRGEDRLPGRVEDGEVGVRSRGYDALCRVVAECPRRTAREQLDEACERHAASEPLGQHHREAGTRAGKPVAVAARRPPRLRRRHRSQLGVVGADGVDRAVDDRPPQCRRVGGCPEGRGDEEPLCVGTVVSALVEHQVMKADLCQHSCSTPLPRQPHLSDGAGRGEVDEVGGGAGEGSDGDRPGDSFLLDLRRARVDEEAQTVAPGAAPGAFETLDERAVLAVHLDDQARLGRPPHQLVEAPRRAHDP